MLSLRRIKAITGKELRQLKRDRMTFAMIVMIPLIQLVLFGYAINTKVRDIPVGVVDQAQTSQARYLIHAFSATSVVRFTRSFYTYEEAQQALKQGEVKAFLYLPADLDRRILERQWQPDTLRPVAQWLVDGSDTMIASAINRLGEMPLFETKERRHNPELRNFNMTLLFNPEQRSAVNIVPGLVAVILTMTMTLFTSAAIVRERERGNIELLIATPLAPMELMLGKIIPYIFVGAIQVSIILGLGHLLFAVPLGGDLLHLVLVTFLFICATLVLGLLISNVAKSQLQAMQMTVFVLLPSILLSGFMFPYEGMPKPAQYLAEALPATHFMRLIRGLLLRDAEVLSMVTDIWWLLGFTLAGLVVAALKFSKRLD